VVVSSPSIPVTLNSAREIPSTLPVSAWTFPTRRIHSSDCQGPWMGFDQNGGQKARCPITKPIIVTGNQRTADLARDQATSRARNGLIRRNAPT